MTSEDFRKVLHHAPFEPFNIRLADGTTLHVPHPDFVAITGTGAAALVTRPNAHGFDIVDMMLVTRLEVPAMQPISA